jgi:EAL domain-containing protein (putative c-di-GMP-specific phosphodiesterase class I)
MPARGNESGPRFELLLRMRSDDGRLIMPHVFLPVAERLDLLRAIDRWVVASGLELLHARGRDGEEPSLEINLSGRSIGDPALLELIEAGVRDEGVDASRLTFEITETGAVENFERARAFAQRVGELGCQFALDNFGAGFGSFYYLKQLPFDYLKIDGEFVRRSLCTRVDQLVIDAVVRIAHALGKQTIAECIEDADTAAMLSAQGVDYLQGYWIGMPRPVEGLFVTA